MKTQPTTCKADALTRLFKATFVASILPASLLLLSIQSSHAGSATWNLSPTSGDWKTATNWTPATIPNGPSDTATFGVSNTTAIFLSGFDGEEVNGIVFDPGASAYTIITEYLSLTISGAGITNNSGSTQTFSTSYDGYGYISFTNSATAGSLTAFTITGGGCAPGGHGSTQGVLAPTGGSATFSGNSSAGSATFANNPAQCAESDPGSTSFSGTSTAANGTFINYGDYVGNPYGAAYTYFTDTSTAANGTFINYGSSSGYQGGETDFWGASTGGTARVEAFDDGNLDISGHNAPGVTTGSVEGNGAVFLGAFNLTVGANNLSTTFSGVIQDGGHFGGSGGSLTKIGTGTLTLAGANTYTGSTTIEGGKLVVNNLTGSSTGAGAVQINAGTLGGRGTIAGAVTVGTGSAGGAVLAPGKHGGKPSTLTIQSALTFNSDAIYNCGMNTKKLIADRVAANGVTISGAQFSFVVRGHRAIPPGTVFTVIDNTAPTPISGTFSNLTDGSTFIAHGNAFQANYEGGDGNDLTLTVVP